MQVLDSLKIIPLLLLNIRCNALDNLKYTLEQPVKWMHLSATVHSRFKVEKVRV